MNRPLLFFSTVALTLFTVASTAAHAVDRRVASACASDYLSLCSEHDPDGPGVRKCFRAKGASLSTRCVDALVAAGEVQKAEVARKSSKR